MMMRLYWIVMKYLNDFNKNSVYNEVVVRQLYKMMLGSNKTFFLFYFVNVTKETPVFSFSKQIDLTKLFVCKRTIIRFNVVCLFLSETEINGVQ